MCTLRAPDRRRPAILQDFLLLRRADALPPCRGVPWTSITPPSPWTTKTGAPRTIHLNAETVKRLTEHRCAQGALKIRNRTSYNDLGLVFAKEWATFTASRSRLDCRCKSGTSGSASSRDRIRTAILRMRSTVSKIAHDRGFSFLRADRTRCFTHGASRPSSNTARPRLASADRLTLTELRIWMRCERGLSPGPFQDCAPRRLSRCDGRLLPR